MKVLTKYILKKYLINFLIVLTSLEVFFVGIDFLQTFKELPQSANLQLLYLFYNSFFTLTLTLPLSLVFAWVLTLTVFIRNNELVAFLSLGIKSSRIYTPIVIVSTVLLLCLIGLQTTPLAYSYEQKRKIFHNHYFTDFKENIFVKYNDNFVYIKKLYPLEKKAEDIHIFKVKDEDIVESIKAKKAIFQNSRWYVIDAKVVKKPHEIKWESSKLVVTHEKFLYILEGFKPKILDNVYGSKASYSIIDAIYAFILLDKQNVNTDSIRASLYYQLFVPFFILPMLILVYKNSDINSRFFRIGPFVNFGIFGTIIIWGIFFMLHKFSSSGVLIPEFSLLIPVVLLYIFTPYIIKKSFPNKVV